MRNVLVSLVAVVATTTACGGSATGPAAPPSNRAAPAPAQHAAVRDPLGFIPVDAEFVASLDMAKLRGSALYRAFEPRLVSMIEPALEVARRCSVDLLGELQRATFGAVHVGGDAYRAVAVLHGYDRARVEACLAKPLDRETVVERDADVFLVRDRDSADVLALAFVAPRVAVAVAGDGVVAADLRAIVKAGSPLRTSSKFVELHGTIDPAASAWIVINGRGQTLRQMAQMGMQPEAVIGWAHVTAKLDAEIRVPLETADHAAQLSTMLQGQIGPARAMVERIDIAARGDTLAIGASITEAQLTTLLQLAGI